jgi:hypothetical protein
MATVDSIERTVQKSNDWVDDGEIDDVLAQLPAEIRAVLEPA